MLRNVLACALLAALGPACLSGGGGGATVELSVIQFVEVDFEDMEPNVLMATDDRALPMDFDAEADYVSLRDRLVCAGLDPAASFLEVVDLDDEVLDTVLLFQLEIAPRGGLTWKPLAEFNGSITQGSLVPLDDPSFTLFEDGLALLSALALDETTPRYDLRILAEVPDPVPFLRVDLTLEVDLSNRLSACP